MKQIMIFTCLVLAILSVSHSGCERASHPVVVVQNEPTVEQFVNAYVEGRAYREESFAEIVKAASGHQMIPLDPEYTLDATILNELEAVVNELIKTFNADGAPVKDKTLEGKLVELLDRCPGFKCDYARNEKGNIQRTGYPDLRWIHTESGRVIYLDPRIVKAGGHSSSLQSFSYTPSPSGKVHDDDANHLLISLEHDDWTFSNWYIVDLYRLKVRLRIGFEANNNEVYLPEYIIRDSIK